MHQRSMLVIFAVAVIAAWPAHSAVIEVSVENNFFNPQDVTAAVGDSIHWTNNGAWQHTVTSGTPCTPDGEFDSGLLDPGQDFWYVVDGDDAGETVPYFCIPHCEMGMVGSYTVEGETATTPTSWGNVRALYR